MKLLSQRLCAFQVVADAPMLPSKDAAPTSAPNNCTSPVIFSNSKFMPIRWQPGPSQLCSVDLHFFNYE